MSLFDKLNNLTQQLNSAADKLTNSNVNTQAVAGNGIEGLGNVNTNNANGYIQTPGSIIDKTDTDSRKLATVMSHFIDSKKYVDYLKQWIADTQLFKISIDDADMYSNSNLVYSGIQRLDNLGNVTNSFRAYGCLNSSEVDNIFNQLATATVKNNSTVSVIMCYINFTKEQIDLAANMRIELVGINEMLEINNAIDLADRKLPYVSFNPVAFTHVVAKGLNEKYKGFQGNDMNIALDGLSNNLNKNAENFTTRAQEAFSGLAAGVGLTKPSTVEYKPENLSLSKQDITGIDESELVPAAHCEIATTEVVEDTTTEKTEAVIKKDIPPAICYDDNKHSGVTLDKH